MFRVKPNRAIHSNILHRGSEIGCTNVKRSTLSLIQKLPNILSNICVHAFETEFFFFLNMYKEMYLTVNEDWQIREFTDII